MAKAAALKLNRRGINLRIGILVSLAHGILATPPAAVSNRLNLAPRALLSRDVYNCTSQSLGSHGVPAWEIQDFAFDRFWNGDVTPSEFRDEIDLAVNNTAINSAPRNCHDLGTRSNPRLDGSKSQRCQGGPRDLTHFSFDYASMTLTLTQEWGCDAADRHHANYFSATEKVVLPLKCAPANGNGTACSVIGKISIPLNNVTATLNSGPKEWDEVIERTS